jgi:hypothetical protein
MFEDNSSVDRKMRRKRLAKQERKCAICQPHRGENAGKRPRPDGHKNKRRKARHASRRP